MATYKSVGLTADSTNPMWSVGKHLRSVDSRFSVVHATATNGDIYLLAGPLSPNARIAYIRGTNYAATSATDNDLGFYTKDATGALVELDKDILWDGITLASATVYRDQLRAYNTSLDTTKTIGDHLGLSADEEPANGIFLALTMNTAPTASGVIDFEVVIEEATSGK